MPTVGYVLDSAKSRFTVQAFARGMLSVMAHDPVIAIRDFTGDMQFDPDALDKTSLQLVVKAASLMVIDKVNAKDKPEIESTMHREVLESARYAEIKYRTSGVSATRIADSWYRLQMNGELSLHGTTKSHAVEAQLRIGEKEVHLSGESKLALSAFKIKPVSAAAGMITLKDELKFAFDLVGVHIETGKGSANG